MYFCKLSCFAFYILFGVFVKWSVFFCVVLFCLFICCVEFSLGGVKFAGI